MEELKRIIPNFAFTGKLCNTSLHNSGHINDTYVIYFLKANGQKHRYILQKINQNVFPEPEKVMDNIEKVTLHLRQKITEHAGDPRGTLNIIPSVEGKNYFKDPGGEYWRAYDYIENACSYQKVQNPFHSYGAGKAVGLFQRMLLDLPPDSLYYTLPGFHNTSYRFQGFLHEVERDPLNRAASVRQEISFIKKRVGQVSILENLRAKSELPLRVVHNDTKFSNILFDILTGEGICLLDLDTVMPGLAVYDFGDAIRSGANAAGSDEPDLSRIHLDMALYEEFSRGYLESVGNHLTLSEKKYLPFSALIMTLECGIRFLTDYLKGDVYFKTRREKHNLDRARVHLKLLEDMENRYEDMIPVIEKYC